MQLNRVYQSSVNRKIKALITSLEIKATNKS